MHILLAAFLSALSVAAASEPFTCDCSWTATHPCDHPVRSATTTSRSDTPFDPITHQTHNPAVNRHTAHTGPPRPSRQDTKPQTGWLGLGGTDECHYYCCPAPPPSPPPPLAPCDCNWVGRDGKHVCPHQDPCPGLTALECREVPASQQVAHPTATLGLPSDVPWQCFHQCCTEPAAPPAPPFPPSSPPPSDDDDGSGFDDSQFLNVDGILSTKDPADIPLIVTIITIIIALPLFCCATCCLYRNAMKEAEKDAVEQARRRAYIGV